MVDQLEQVARREPPGPPGRWPFGHLPEMAPQATRFQTIQGWRRAYGDVFTIQLGPRKAVMVADPAVAKRVLLDNAKNYPKSAQYDKLKGLLGEGLLTSSGDFWLRQRRMMQPYFHQKYITGLLPPMVAATEDLRTRWAAHAATGQPIDVAAEMMALTLRIVGLTLFSTDVAGEAGKVGHALTSSLEAANEEFFTLVSLPPWWPTKRRREAREARAELDQVVYGIIAERRRHPRPADAPRDLLDMLLAAVDEESGQGMSDRQLRDEAMTIVLAGHETTATALGWTFYLLSKHPEAGRRVREEVREVLGDRPPTWDDLGRLAYTGRVIDEAMRLYPPIYVIQRTAVEDDELGGYRVAAGTDVTISIYAIHHNQAHWENPEGFDPDRFLPERSAGRERYAFMPFSGGGRICIGNNFALMEAKVVLAMIAQKFRLDLVTGHPVVPHPMVVLRPKHGLSMYVKAL